MLLICFYSQKTKKWSEVKISFTDWLRHIYLPSIGWEWDRAYDFPYLGQAPLPRWASPRWAQEFCNHRNIVGKVIKGPRRGCNAETFSGRVDLCPRSTTSVTDVLEGMLAMGK